MLKFKLNDQVKIKIGKDKGKEGKIEKIFPKELKVLVSGANVYKKHIKGFQGQKGGIYDIPRPMEFSKLSLICPKCKKETRVGFKVVGENKYRVCKKCKKEIDTK